MKKMKNQIRLLLLLTLCSLTSCTSYRSTWECPKAKVIGCSSLEYADEVAREQILLNMSEGKNKKILCLFLQLEICGIKLMIKSEKA
jgi:hypothetical protein